MVEIPRLFFGTPGVKSFMLGTANDTLRRLQEVNREGKPPSLPANSISPKKCRVDSQLNMLYFISKMPQTFGQRLRELRQQKNLSQRELAERVAERLKEDKRGFDFTYLSKIENDKMPPPSVPAILELAAELDADSDELLALGGKAPADLSDTLKQSQGARTFYRSALNMKLSEKEWQRLLAELERKKRDK